MQITPPTWRQRLYLWLFIKIPAGMFVTALISLAIAALRLWMTPNVPFVDYDAKLQQIAIDTRPGLLLDQQQPSVLQTLLDYEAAFDKEFHGWDESKQRYTRSVAIDFRYPAFRDKLDPDELEHSKRAVEQFDSPAYRALLQQVKDSPHNAITASDIREDLLSGESLTAMSRQTRWLIGRSAAAILDNDIDATLWHLGTHQAMCEMIRAEPSLIPWLIAAASEDMLLEVIGVEILVSDLSPQSECSLRRYPKPPLST